MAAPSSNLEQSESTLEHFRNVLLSRPQADRLRTNLLDAESKLDSFTDAHFAQRLAAIVAACYGRLGETSKAHSIVSRYLLEANPHSSSYNELRYIRAVIFMMENRTAEAVELLEEILASLTSDAEADILRSRVLNVLGGLYGDQGHIDDSIRVLEENVILRERLGEPAALAVAYYNYGEAWKRLEDHDSAYEYLQRAYNIERAYSLNLQSVSSAGSLAVLAAKRGEEAQARAYANESVALANESGIDHQIVSATMFRAEALAALGYVAEAESDLRLAVELTQGKQLDDLRIHALAQLAEITCSNGNLDEAYALLTDAFALVVDQTNSYNTQRLQLVSIRLAAARNHVDTMWEVAQEVMPSLAEVRNVTAMLEVLDYLSEQIEMQPAGSIRLSLLQEWIRLISKADADRTRFRLSIANLRFARERRQHETDVERVRNVELAQAMDRLQQANATLQQLASDQRDILRLVAHDLRSPLSALRELIGHVDADKTSGATDEALVIVDQVLSKVRVLLEADRSGIAAVELVNLTYIVRRSAERQQGVALRRGITLRLRLEEQVWCDTDVGIVSSIIDNLVSNALKFTPHGGEVAIAVKQYSQDIAITVSDTGQGVPEDLHDVLFTQYGRTHDTSEPIASTGLGLYLSKRMAERLGGTISYQPGALGVGSVFTLTLPNTNAAAS